MLIWRTRFYNAERMGKGFRIKRAVDIEKVLKQALAYNDRPYLIHAEVVKEDNVFPMIPLVRLQDMIIDPPKLN